MSSHPPELGSNAPPIYCEIDGLCVELRTEDLNRVGMFVRSVMPRELDDELEIFMRSQHGSVHISATVVHTTSCEQAAAEGRVPGFSVFFLEPTVAQRNWLERTLGLGAGSLPRAPTPADKRLIPGQPTTPLRKRKRGESRNVTGARKRAASKPLRPRQDTVQMDSPPRMSDAPQRQPSLAPPPSGRPVAREVRQTPFEIRIGPIIETRADDIGERPSVPLRTSSRPKQPAVAVEVVSLRPPSNSALPAAPPLRPSSSMSIPAAARPSSTVLPALNPAPMPAPSAAPQLNEEGQRVLAQLQRQLSSMKEHSARRILDVAQNATPEQLKAAYFQASRRYHPHQFSRHNSAEISRLATDIFVRCKHAYEQLLKQTQAGTPTPAGAPRRAGGR